MNKETPTELNLLRDVKMSNGRRKHAIGVLRDMVHNKEETISSLVDDIKTLLEQLTKKRGSLIAQQIACEAIQRELAEWEEPKHEESNRDPSPF